MIKMPLQLTLILNPQTCLTAFACSSHNNQHN